MRSFHGQLLEHLVLPYCPVHCYCSCFYILWANDETGVATLPEACTLSTPNTTGLPYRPYDEVGLWHEESLGDNRPEFCSCTTCSSSCVQPAV